MENLATKDFGNWKYGDQKCSDLKISNQKVGDQKASEWKFNDKKCSDRKFGLQWPKMCQQNHDVVIELFLQLNSYGD